jgi:hypothetical protein
VLVFEARLFGQSVLFIRVPERSRIHQLRRLRQGPLTLGPDMLETPLADTCILIESRISSSADLRLLHVHALQPVTV